MNRSIALVAATTVLAGALYALQLTDALSLGVLGVTLAVGAVFYWLVKRSIFQHATKYSLTDKDSPLAAALFGALQGSILLVVAALGFATAWACGVWHTPWQTPLTLAGKAIERSRQLPAAAAFSVRIVGSEYHEPFLFLDVLVLGDDDRPVEALQPVDFSVRLTGTPQSLHTVTPIQYESPRHVAVFRDVSGSVRGNPYPELAVVATNAVVQALRESPRKALLRVANFSDITFDVSPWTDKLDAVVTQCESANAKAEVSAIVVTMVAAIDDMSQRAGGRRIVLVTDGGNNVPSGYSAAGLVAHARRTAVVIDVVALPTEHLQPPQRAFLELLARETGGNYIDAASPTAAKDLKRALLADRDRQSAYRLTVEQVPLERMADLSVEVKEASAAAIVTTVAGSSPTASRPNF